MAKVKMPIIEVKLKTGEPIQITDPKKATAIMAAIDGGAVTVDISLDDKKRCISYRLFMRIQNYWSS
ncbi:hypothetical protein OLM08_00165 (plasmid) [Enterococcus faecalis]|nr:hypothetical protein OLM08_00165 [Enterococcus faecalis]